MTAQPTSETEWVWVKYFGTISDPGLLHHYQSKMAAEGVDSRTFKLVVFGGTGGTGKEVVAQALERGHHVTAVVRTPEKVEKRYVIH